MAGRRRKKPLAGSILGLLLFGGALFFMNGAPGVSLNTFLSALSMLGCLTLAWYAVFGLGNRVFVERVKPKSIA